MGEETGDSLLLECSPHLNVNTDSLASQLHFFDSDQVVNIGPGTLVSAAVMIAMVTLSALGVMSLLQCAVIAAAAMVVLRCYSVDQAMKADKLGYDPFPFLIALMISVSSSFATPIGSPTHMLVYGPGGYRFSDFLRIGLPMNVVILAANIFIDTIKRVAVR